MKASRLTSFLLSAVLLLAFPSALLSQDVRQTPPLGWNSWNHFGLRHHPPTDAMIRAQALAMVNSGMHAVGYTYVNIDDEWQGTRDSQGNIQPNPNNFPNGMAPVAAYVHSLGLKIGIYSSPGEKTCSGHIGSYGHEQQDANTFASWGMDYLKYDWCGATGDPITVFKLMHTSLRNTGRPFVYSISNYGNEQVWKWAGPESGANLWRTGPDVKDSFFIMAETGFGNDGLGGYAGPNKGWNDPDMLQIGNGRMSIEQYRTQMSLWGLMAAPLIAGNDLTKLLDKNDTTQQQYLALLANPYIIAVDQDPLGIQGHRVWQQGPDEIWVKPMADGSTVVGVFNRVLGNATIALPFGKIGVQGPVDAFNLWSGKDLGNIQNGHKVELLGFSAVMLKLTPVK
jgi:alpha-galactosidase